MEVRSLGFPCGTREGLFSAAEASSFPSVAKNKAQKPEQSEMKGQEVS